MRKRLRDNDLSIVLFGLFAIFLLGQAFTGWRTYNAEQREHREPTVGLGSYLTTGHFVEATFENWESEFLQMAAYVLLTIWLIQKGSSESKPPGGDPEKDADPRSESDTARAPAPVRRGGWQLVLYENSLGIVLALLFVLSFVLHALGRGQGIQRGAGGSRGASGEHPEIRDDIHVLVPVVPELAERVRGGRQHRGAHDLPPSTWLS